MNNVEYVRILVMGAGAIGSVTGGLMAKAGHTVTLVGRPAHMNAIAAEGLRITGIWGEHHITTLNPHTDAASLMPGNYDIILMAVKSYDTPAAMNAIQHLVDEHTLVCSYQNGLGNAENIAAIIGWERTIGARVIYGARLTQPGIAEVTVIANPTALGIYHPATPADRVRALAEAMNAALVPTIFTDKIATALWGKVAYNCALNPLSALLDVPYGVLVETEYTRSIMEEAVHELYAVGRAKGVALEPDTPEGYMKLFYEKLIPPTAAHYASMREDFQRRRRTEIEALNGAIARYGRECGVPCPVNTLLTRLVHAREYALGVNI
ncbi:MAG TPA: 2-dehydropantoate 2-reductase [Candidatus Hydrogenedentes bacterium]|nr:2-dehydropantoate 2-reductase [Candidatus Hydrogenedentota bacterium]